MAAGRLIIPGWMPAVDADGVPIPNAKIFYYENRTTILATVYADAGLTTPISNPVVANSAGHFPDTWADTESVFSATVEAPYGPPGTPFTYDDVQPSQTAGGVVTGTNKGGWRADTNVPIITSGVGKEGDFYTVEVAGDTLIDGAGPWAVGDQILFKDGLWTKIENPSAPVSFEYEAIPRSTIEKIKDRVSVKDFGAFGDGASHTLAATSLFRGVDTSGFTLADWKAYFPSATSLGQEIDFLAHEQAIKWAKSINRPIDIHAPAGKYHLGVDTIVVDRGGTSITGDGPDATVWMTSKPSGDVFVFKDMGAGGIFKGTIAAMVDRTGGSAIRFENGHNLISRDMRFDPGVLHGGPAGADHWSCYDMYGGAEQFLYTVEHYEMNSPRFGFRLGQTGGYVQDVWIGKGVCVAQVAGIDAYHVGGLYIYNMPDFLVCGWGLRCIPNTGQVVSGMMVNGFLADTCRYHGVLIQPNGGWVVDFQMSDVWSSSNGTNVPGGEASLSACGVLIDGTVGKVSAGIINGLRCINNVTNGIQIRNADAITLSNPQCTYNSIQSPGTFHGIVLDTGAKNVSVFGGFSGPAGKFKLEGLATTQGLGVFINAGAVDCRVMYVDVTGNIQPGIFNAGTNCFVAAPGAAISQPIDTQNRFGPSGINRSPLPNTSLATANNVSVGGFAPIMGFNVYYDGTNWRYQNNGPAAALVAYAAGLTLVRFAENSSGADAIAAVASSGVVAVV